jgi:hypothetical protein
MSKFCDLFPEKSQIEQIAYAKPLFEEPLFRNQVCFLLGFIKTEKKGIPLYSK